MCIDCISLVNKIRWQCILELCYPCILRLQKRFNYKIESQQLNSRHRLSGLRVYFVPKYMLNIKASTNLF